MPSPCRHLRQAASAPPTLYGVLQWCENTPFPEQGCAGTTGCSGHRAHFSDSNSLRITPSPGTADRHLIFKHAPRFGNLRSRYMTESFGERRRFFAGLCTANLAGLFSPSSWRSVHQADIDATLAWHAKNGTRFFVSHKSSEPIQDG